MLLLAEVESIRRVAADRRIIAGQVLGGHVVDVRVREDSAKRGLEVLDGVRIRSDKEVEIYRRAVLKRGVASAVDLPAGNTDSRRSSGSARPGCSSPPGKFRPMPRCCSADSSRPPSVPQASWIE